MDGGTVRNRYPGTCDRCGDEVKAGQGHFEYQNYPGNRWPQMARLRSVPLVQHASCAITYKGTNTHYLYQPDPYADEVIERDWP